MRRRLPFASGRRRVAAALGVVVLLASATALTVGLAGVRHDRKMARTVTARPARRLPDRPTSDGLSWHTPATVASAGTPVQEEGDQQLQRSLSGAPGLAAVAALRVPAPAFVGGWSPLPPTETPDGWATAFVEALLDVDYAHQSRSGCEAWLQAQEAPELLPGLPPSAADKVLYASLIDPDVAGGGPTPVPSSEQWNADARAGVVQSATGLLVQPDPSWSQLVAAGWQPADARMAVEDVSGLLTVRQAGRAVTHRFRMGVAVGSARWHDGYGTVAVGGWEES